MSVPVAGTDPNRPDQSDLRPGGQAQSRPGGPAQSEQAHSEPRLTDRQFDAALERLDDLVREFESLGYPQIREKVFDLLQVVDAVHREALHRLVERVAAHEPNAVKLAAGDRVVRTLLALYEVDPQLAAPEIDQGPGDGEPSEAELSATDAHLAGAARSQTAPRGSVPAAHTGAAHTGAAHISIGDIEAATEDRARQRPRFVAALPASELPEGTRVRVEIDGVPVLVARVDGQVYAVRDRCPGSMAPLSLGVFNPPKVVCPWHQDAFDVRTGERLDDHPGGGLHVLPVRVTDGDIRVAANAPAGPLG